MAERKTHLRIDFIVREVSDDGETSADDLRYVKFGDDVPIPHVRDFFDRCGSAMGTIFKQGHAVICLESAGINKIGVIKIVRELTGYGLKESKDIVESPSGIGIVSTEDHYSLQHAIRLFNEVGAKVEVRSFSSTDGRRVGPNGISLPPIPVFKRSA